jgi:glycosyltransferase involved in cell wall biosynthesis
LQNEPRIKWVIIGGGHQEAYRKRAADLGLGDTLQFTGHLSNPIPAIKGLDAFALLSTAHEGVSQAILQAAFLERPLIATRTGGLAEVCLDDKTGIEVPPFAPDAVAAAVLKLMGDAPLCRSYGQNGRALVLKRFTLKQTVDEMEDVYRKVMQC